MDGAIPMDAMTQTAGPLMWMPGVRSDSDIPLQERDARTLETLTRKALNIAAMQDHTLAAIRAVLTPRESQEFVAQEMIQTLSLAIRDIIKVSSHMLTAIVQLRRDAVLAHAWDDGQCKKLRHADILF